MHSPLPRLPLPDEAIARMERSTRDAVAPPTHEEQDGWLLSFDHSTIGRARSAVPLRHHSLGTDALPRICARYAEHGLPAIFRLADVPGLAAVHAGLGREGFAPEQPTLVQVAHCVEVAALHAKPQVRCTTTPTASWGSVYVAPGFDPVDGANRVQALSRGQHAVYASLELDGQPVCAGTAVYSQGWASLHGLRTVPGARGRGLAAQLLASLAQEALRRGLPHMFLQVEEDNPPALALYRRAGFASAWRYQYWHSTKVRGSA